MIKELSLSNILEQNDPLSDDPLADDKKDPLSDDPLADDKKDPLADDTKKTDKHKKKRTGLDTSGGNGGARDNQNFQDEDTIGAHPCEDNKFPIVYGCISNAVGNLKQALHLDPLNDNTYGNHLLDLLAYSGKILNLDSHAAQQYKKDHNFQITKEMYDSIMQSVGKLTSDGKLDTSNTTTTTNTTTGGTTSTTGNSPTVSNTTGIVAATGVDSTTNDTTTQTNNSNQTQQPTIQKYSVGDVLEGDIDGKKYKITIKSVNGDDTYSVDVEDAKGNVTKGKVNENKKLSIFDLILEDNTNKGGGFLLDDKGYHAILNFENSLGRVTNDGKGGFKPIGMGYKTIKGMIQEERIKSHIENTIGLDNWFKIPMLFRVQIYSYMFNSDSDQAGDHFRWLAGLAQSIDPSFDRSSIVKSPTEKPKPNTETAIKLIKDSIESNKINSYYSSYVDVLDKQYQSIKDNTKSPQNDANYDLLWSKRPKYLERLYNGEKIGEVLSGVEKETGTPKTNTSDTPSLVGRNQTLKLVNGSLGPFKITNILSKVKINEIIRKTTTKVLTETLVKQNTKKLLKTYFK